MEKDIYYERTINLQRKKIIDQEDEIERLSRIYNRDIRNITLISALKFLFDVIIKKIKK